MSIVLIGGMDRLEQHYRREAKKHGHQITMYSTDHSRIASSIQGADAVVLFTNKVSHQARHKAVDSAKKQGVPVYMYHSCGLCTLRNCLECLGQPTDTACHQRGPVQ